MKKIMTMFLTLICYLSLFSCNFSSNNKNEITIWVGSESVNFYQNVLNEYVETTFKELYPNYTKPHPKIVVKSSDAGSAAANYIRDIEAGADIFTIPSNNLIELTMGNPAIAPIKLNSKLADYVNSSTPKDILNVITGVLKNNEKILYGVPYISQNLILYYNKALVSDPNALSFEGLLESAGNSFKAFTLAGTSSYQNSFLMLASDGNGNYPISLYENNNLNSVDFTNEEAVKIFERGREIFQKGYLSVPDGAWLTALRNKTVLSVISGAWDFESARQALGQDLGIKRLPTFNVGNHKYHAGTFNDVKMFVKKINSPFSEYLDPILLYLSSKEMQERSFSACNNLPSHIDAQNFSVMEGNSLQIELAKAQFEMLNYGKPQPFSTIEMNSNFYSKEIDRRLLELLRDERNLYNSFEKIKAYLLVIESTLKGEE